MNVRQRWNQTSLPNKLNVGLTALIVLMTGVNCCFFVKQVLDQDKQVKQIEDAITYGIDKAKTVSTESTKASHDSLSNILNQNRAAFEKTLDENRQEHKRSTSATLAQGKAALDATIAMSKIDQRAYVWVTSAGVMDVPVAEDRPVVLELRYVTGGKTPAVNIDIRYRCLFGGRIAEALEAPIVSGEIVPDPTIGRLFGLTLMPGTGGSYKMTCGLPAPPDRRAQMVSVQGYISYGDINGEPHRTDWCIIARFTKGGTGNLCGHRMR